MRSMILSGATLPAMGLLDPLGSGNSLLLGGCCSFIASSFRLLMKLISPAATKRELSAS
jgi:hypothetical protein